MERKERATARGKDEENRPTWVHEPGACLHLCMSKYLPHRGLFPGYDKGCVLRSCFRMH